jgi:tetratricopeptide (TPR) repeat protein
MMSSFPLIIKLIRTMLVTPALIAMTGRLRMVLGVTALVLAPSLVHAEHPAYLHALKNLRYAQAHLERHAGDEAFRWDEHVASQEIDQAIREIKEAAIDDGKKLEDLPPINLKVDYVGRVRGALDLLRRAKGDCSEEEDNAFAKGLRQRALTHIGEAIRLTEEALRNHHPAYLNAISDLRHARAFLERRGGDEAIRWDEHIAIREIDQALREIKEAAIDDGKKLEDHRPVDFKIDYAGRLHSSLELLRKARADCAEEEDNVFAGGLRLRAIKNIDYAIQVTEGALREAHRL